MANLYFSPQDLYLHNLDVGSRNAESKDFKNVIKILEEDAIPVSDIITSTIPFEKTGEIMKDWAEDPSRFIKIVISFD